MPADSAFTPEQVISGVGTYFAPAVSENRLKRAIRKRLPSLADDYDRDAVDRMIRHELSRQPGGLTGLVVGSGTKRPEISSRFPGVQWVMTDVDLAYGPDLVADATRLPFATESFDLVVAEMVLEHTIDIVSSASELQRICRVGGLCLVKVPFCFPWHGVPLDFFRCTPSGLRVLFRSAETVHLGRCMGSWGALAYLLENAVVNLWTSRGLRMAGVFASRFLFGWLKWLDRRRPDDIRHLDATSGVTFVGRKVPTALSARDLIEELTDRFGAPPSPTPRHGRALGAESSKA
jgi:SAM-dependent methyltransferase